MKRTIKENGGKITQVQKENRSVKEERNKQNREGKREPEEENKGKQEKKLRKEEERKGSEDENKQEERNKRLNEQTNFTNWKVTCVECLGRSRLREVALCAFSRPLSLCM
jgi:hypothetical protein